MYLRSVLLFLLFIAVSVTGFAQIKDAYKQPRILILLDGSSSMINEWSAGKSRFNSAGDIVLRLMDSIYRLNDQVEFALRVYGHEHTVPENNCFDTKREVMFSKNNLTQMSLRLASLHPMGVSPIAYSLKVAAETDFDNERDYAYSLVLITDGGESCDGDICSIVKMLLDKKIEFKPYIISMVDYEPLKDQYDCLGKYLTVSKPSEVAPAIHTITEAYRKVLSVPIAKPKLLESSIPAPSVQKINVPSVKVQINEPETTIAKKPEIKPEEPKPQPVVETPKNAEVRVNVSKIKVDQSFFTKEKIEAIKPRDLSSIQYPLYLSIVKLKKKQVPLFSLPQAETPPVAATSPKQNPALKPNTIKAIAPVKNEIKEATYTVNVEPAAETLLEVFFTDGKGKFYTTTPQIQVLDAKTGNEIKRFYRTVDAAGNPDPQKIPPGNYTLILGKKGNYKTKSITVQPASSNKVTVVVTKGTLIFRYEDNHKRPVKEFTASVRKTFHARSNVFQKCTEELEYEPANYHIEINTMPMIVRNIDLEFGWSYIIDIPEPGFVQFTNSNIIGKVSLWTPLGDQYARFHQMELNGDQQSQHLRLLPGVYEIHWKRNPSRPLEPDVVQRFFVKSNETTEVELK